MTNAALTVGGKIAGIVPQSIEEVFRLATAVAKSGLAPSGMKTPEQLTVAIMHGMEIGLPPMQAIQRIAVVNGRPTVWGDAIPALLTSRGFSLRESIEGVGDDRVAVCVVVRPDGETIKRHFSVDDAKTAGLWSKAGPWKQYPSRMLQMRARGFAARDGAADVLAGLYLREEIEDLEMKDITPAAAKTVVQPSAGPSLPPVVGEADEVQTDLEEARTAIAEAASVEMLNHVREAYADVDWSGLEAEFTAKMDELTARAA